MLKRRLSRAAGQTMLAAVALSMMYFVQVPAAAQVLVNAAFSSNADTSDISVFNDSLALLDADAPVIGLQPQAKKFVAPYIRKNEEHLEKIGNRGEDLMNTIESVFRKQGLPAELKYLAVVESNLKYNAVSRVGAVGLWQLMPETARDFGLKVKGRTDERKNTYKSTVAAGKYIKCLYNEFGDWLLVIAAYNGGSGTVQRAIKKAGSHNYWAVRRFLPAETRGHVEHFISTHYYYEGRGSWVTLTRAETAKYKQEISAYLGKRACEAEQALAAATAAKTSVGAAITATGAK
jgi:membrane-bound lytic murein transglycosylase D